MMTEPHQKAELAPRAPGPIRQSVSTKDRLAKARMVRLVLSPEGKPGIDLASRGPGRGQYVEADRAVLRHALSQKGLGKIYRGKAKALSVKEIEDLIDEAVRRLEDRIIELCGLARRSGDVVLGLEPVVAMLEAGKVQVVVQAADLSQRSTERLAPALARAGARRVVLSDKAEIGRKLGRVDLGVVAIRPSTLAERLAVEAERHQGLMGASEV